MPRARRPFTNTDLLGPIEQPGVDLDRLAAALAERILPAMVEQIAARIVAMLPERIRGLAGVTRNAWPGKAGRPRRPTVNITPLDFEQTRAFQRRLGRTS